MGRALLLPLIALAACSATTHVASDYDHGAQFSSFHSFILIMRPHPGTPNPLVDQQTYDAIQADLTSKGFTRATNPVQADFAVDFTVGARDRMDVHSYPGTYGGPWLAAGWWGNQLDVRQYQEGTLSIDIFDVHSRRPVWHGSAKRDLSESDVERSGPLIREAVAMVLAAFPPNGT